MRVASGCGPVGAVEGAANRCEGRAMIRISPVQALVIASLGAALAACSTDSGPKEVGGTLVGAGAGALIGNAIGGAAGNRAVGTLAGAALGGMLGNRIGAA